MNTLEITRLSSKGQVVIPNLIRNQLHLNTGAKFMILTEGNIILLKPIQVPKMQEFDSLIRRSRKLKSKIKLTKSKLRQTIEKVRNESSH